jgi:pSer/pThr/pTyr-binding forkhead associated (FHA) protein
MRAQLIPLDGGSPVDIVKDLTLVGRKDDCDLRLDHKSVSKMHCVIVKTDGLLLLRDLGSTNGTRVNGQRVRRAALLPNDQVAIASYKFRVHLGPDDLAKPPIPLNEHTQQLDANEVANLLRQAKAANALEDSAVEEPHGAPMQPNALPDVYPDDGKSS